jgi:alpha-galactosidase
MLRRSFVASCAGAAACGFLPRAARSSGPDAAVSGEEVLAPTPPMGWMSWNQFGPDVSDALVREMADAMVTSGMKAAGYTYLCIDDLWQGGRNRAGSLYPDPKRFPAGIEAVADFVHSKGLKLGIYTDVAEKTCGDQPGSLGYEDRDAAAFASWGVDYLKCDYCYAPEDQETATSRYRTLAQALRRTGRPIVFAVCEWGPREPWTWAARIGAQLWRTTWDVRDIWEGEYNDDHLGITNILDRQADLADYAGPGHWNDPDMLVIGLRGKGRYTSPRGWAPPNDVEYRSQMSLWCLMASPLLATCDLRAMDPATREILTNRDVIAVNQDPLGRQARRAIKDRHLEVWKKPLADGRVALGLLNRGPQADEVRLKWTDVALKPSWRVRDLWTKEDLGTVRDTVTRRVASHETCVLLLS